MASLFYFLYQLIIFFYYRLLKLFIYVIFITHWYNKMSKAKKISSLIPKIFKSLKQNSNLLELKANWEEVVGKNFSVDVMFIV